MDEHEQPLPRMSRAQFWGAFALLLALFVLVEGPIWRHAWDTKALNRAILWSYFPIPLLVAASLAASRRFGWKAFFLDTLSLTCLKYSATFTLAICAWALSPEPAAERATAHAAAAPEAPAPVSVIPDERRGDVTGRVVDAAGLPVAGASVFVSKGLEDLSFAPRADAVALANEGSGIEPRFAVAQVGERIEARASDGRLHTLIAAPSDASAPAFNVPLMKSGATSVAMVHEPRAGLRLWCSVHPGTEEVATLVVVAHPFFTTTNAEGRFTLARVPSAHLAITARAGESDAVREVDLAPKATMELALALADHLPTR